MGAIVDTLYLDLEELSLIQGMYPDCKVINQSHSDYSVQKYRIIIPHEDWCLDSYYIFLIDNRIAMSSNNFVGRIASDQRFVNRMSTRIAELADKTNGAVRTGQIAPDQQESLYSGPATSDIHRVER